MGLLIAFVLTAVIAGTVGFLACALFVGRQALWGLPDYDDERRSS